MYRNICLCLLLGVLLMSIGCTKNYYFNTAEQPMVQASAPADLQPPAMLPPPPPMMAPPAQQPMMPPPPPVAVAPQQPQGPAQPQLAAGQLFLNTVMVWEKGTAAPASRTFVCMSVPEAVNGNRAYTGELPPPPALLPPNTHFVRTQIHTPQGAWISVWAVASN